MINNSQSELVALPFGKKSQPLTHRGYLQAGSFNQSGKVPKKLERFLLRHFAGHYLSSVALPPLFAVIQGRPGDGKTYAVRKTCSDHGIDLIVVPAPEFAGETEGAGSEKLPRLREAVHAISERENRPFALLFDDFDLSSVARLGSTEYTVNSQLLTGALQHLADTGGWRTAQGYAVPIVMTGNDFTALRSSLLRPGRALFYKHAPNLDEKCEIVAGLLGTSDPKDARELVCAYQKEPIAFFAELRSRALDEKLDALIAQHGFNLAAIQHDLNGLPNSIDLDRLHKLAAEAAVSRAKTYLKRR